MTVRRPSGRAAGAGARASGRTGRRASSTHLRPAEAALPPRLLEDLRHVLRVAVDPDPVAVDEDLRGAGLKGAQTEVIGAI